MAGDRRCARLLSAAFAILILLSACSAQPEPEVEETAAPETGETDWVYVPEFTRLADWAGCFALAGERLYFDGVETLASGQETGGAVTRHILRSAPALGGEVSDLASFEAAPTPEGASVSGGISCMCALPDGGFAAVERAFFSMPEPMEETSGATSSDLAAGFESAESHILHIFDAAGESRAVKDITGLLGGEGVEACAADAAGYIYLLTSGGGALVLDRGGGFVSRSAGEGGFSGLVRLGEKVCALLNTQEGISLLPIDPVGAAAGKEELLLPASAQEPYPGTEHALLWSDGERLLGLAPGEEEPEELLYFSDAGLDGDMLAAAFQEEGGDILCLAWESDGTWLVRLEKTAASQAPVKTRLTLAGLDIDYGIRRAVLDFNRRDGGSVIELRDYAGEGEEAFLAEMAAGKLPDILCTDSLPADSLADKGLLRDLAPYIEGDAALGGFDALVTPYFDALRRDGALYEVSEGFCLRCCMAPAELEGRSLDLATLRELAEGLPEVCTLLGPEVTAASLFRELCMANLERYADAGSGVCRFTTQEFISLLKFCGGFPREAAQEKSAAPHGIMEAGAQLIASTSFDRQLLDYVGNKAAMGGEICLPGVLGGDGSAAFVKEPGLAISASCKAPEAAWSFVRTLLTEEYQAGARSGLCLPSNRAVLEALLEARSLGEGWSEQHYLIPGQGTQSYAPGSVGGESFTREDAQLLLAAIDGAKGLYGTQDEELLGIVNEEAGRFFAGDCTAEQCAAVIQDRVSIYINERR